MNELDFIKEKLEHKKTESFILYGEHYAGNIDDHYKKYVKEKPSKSFRGWLIDKGFRVSLISY